MLGHILVNFTQFGENNVVTATRMCRRRVVGSDGPKAVQQTQMIFLGYKFRKGFTHRSHQQPAIWIIIFGSMREVLQVRKQFIFLLLHSFHGNFFQLLVAFNQLSQFRVFLPVFVGKMSKCRKKCRQRLPQIRVMNIYNIINQEIGAPACKRKRTTDRDRL